MFQPEQEVFRVKKFRENSLYIKTRLLTFLSWREKKKLLTWQLSQNSSTTFSTQVNTKTKTPYGAMGESFSQRLKGQPSTKEGFMQLNKISRLEKNKQKNSAISLPMYLRPVPIISTLSGEWQKEKKNKKNLKANILLSLQIQSHKLKGHSFYSTKIFVGKQVG